MPQTSYYALKFKEFGVLSLNKLDKQGKPITYYIYLKFDKLLGFQKTNTFLPYQLGKYLFETYSKNVIKLECDN